MFFERFMCTVYKILHDESLKNISVITFISLAILKMFKNVSSQT